MAVWILVYIDFGDDLREGRAEIGVRKKLAAGDLNVATIFATDEKLNPHYSPTSGVAMTTSKPN